MLVPLRLTIIFLAKPLLDLWLRPRRHSEQQHLFQAPDMIGQARRHCRGTRLPHLRRATAVGRLGSQQRLAQTGVRQDKVVVDVEHRQLMLQTVLALAQCVDPTADRGHALANVQIESLYELVASFANPSNLLKYEKKTHACAATIPTEHTGKACCDHTYSRPISVTECHAFF